VTEEIQLLLALQGEDHQHAKLRSQVKRLEVQKAEVERRLTQERASVDKLCQHLRQLEQTSRQKNLEVDDLDMQIRQYRKRLDEGIISFKEMEALRTKIVNQRQRISEMEDEALALMDDIETAKTQLAEAKETLAEREAELTGKSQEISSQIAQVNEEITARQKERAGIAAKIAAHLLTYYEKLHTEYDDPVVVIMAGICSGCKLKVSGNTIERARSSMEIITCENCSRILYVQ